MRGLAQDMLKDMLTFVDALRRWIDERFEALVSNSTPEESAWYIVTKVMRAIFQDFMGPKRLGHISGSKFKGNQRAAEYIWYCI